MSTAIIPMTKVCGVVANKAGLTIFVLRVDVTSCPNKTAPRNSNTPAIMIACLRVIALEPTEVPMALATSFAPKFQAT